MQDVELISPDGVPFTAGTPTELNDLINRGYRRVDEAHRPAAGAGEAAPQQPAPGQDDAPAPVPDPTPSQPEAAQPEAGQQTVHIPGPPPPSFTPGA